MVSLKMSILQIWVTWAAKITFKNLQLCSIKIKGSHAPCDVTCSRSIYSTALRPLKVGVSLLGRQRRQVSEEAGADAKQSSLPGLMGYSHAPIKRKTTSTVADKCFVDKCSL